MIRHLTFATIGSGIFFLTTLILLKVSEAGIQVEGYLNAVESGILFRHFLVDASLLGAVTGGLASLVFRNSVNQRLYVGITISLTLVFLEFFLLTILRSA